VGKGENWGGGGKKGIWVAKHGCITRKKKKGNWGWGV